MSYVALATLHFEELAHFYGELLGFPTVRHWDRPTARGRIFDLDGLRLEVLDASREPTPLNLGSCGDRFHLVVEVADLEATRRGFRTATPEPIATDWGAASLRLSDPDGNPVWFLQWRNPPPA